MKRALGKVGCDWSDLGIKTNQGSWQLSMPFGFSMKCAHCFRQFWRNTQFKKWLRSSRRDATMARDQGVVSSMTLIDHLRSYTQTATAGQIAVVCGGLTTDAHHHDGGPGLRDFCPSCGGAVCPSTQHVYWHCPAFQSFRLHPEPQHDAVLSRMGWSPVSGPNQVLIGQMVLIRRAHDAEFRKRRVGKGGVGASEAPASSTMWSLLAAAAAGLWLRPRARVQLYSLTCMHN